jgi:hypothetical protein
MGTGTVAMKLVNFGKRAGPSFKTIKNGIDALQSKNKVTLISGEKVKT